MGNTKSKSCDSSESDILPPISLPVPTFSPSLCDNELIETIGSIATNSYIYDIEAYYPYETYSDVEYEEKEQLCDQMNDCWSLYDPKYFGLNNNIPNTIHRNMILSSTYKNKWLSVFGTDIVSCGRYKKWEIKIIPRFYSINISDFIIADIVVGICDISTINNNNKNNKYNSICSEYWLLPYFGYGYYGFNGKKYHQNNSRGKEYGIKYKINDIITIELNMLNNNNNLIFYVNNKSNGISYNVDKHRDYILAISLCNSNYDIQIL